MRIGAHEVRVSQVPKCEAPGAPGDPDDVCGKACEPGLDPKLSADGVGDGLGVALHGFVAFGFDHDAGQGFGAAVADDDAAGVFQLILSGA